MPEGKIIGGVPGGGAFGVPGTELLIEQQFQAARVTPKPLDYVFNGQVLGHYRVGAPTGLSTGIAAAGILFSCRWTDTKSLLVLTRLAVGAVVTTAFTAAQAVDADAIVVRGFTAADTGQTAITLPTQKVRKTMGDSLVADMRIAGTAAVAAGTGTADPNAFAIGAVSQTNAVGSGGSMPSDLYNIFNPGQHPVVLSTNEGFRIRVVTAQGAVGVVKYYVTAEWAEVAAY